MVLGAVLVGGQVMRTLPHDQTLIFPVGSVFPEATRFSASWQTPGAKEPSGGVTVSFKSGPPLQIREQARLPNGDYIVTIVVVQPKLGARTDRPPVPEPKPEPESKLEAGETNHETVGAGDELQTNIERRVSLSGGETMIALAASPSPL